MDRAETRIDRRLIERARERARREGREESELVEDALRRYLDDEEKTFGDILDEVADWQERHGIERLSEDEAIEMAVEEQHAHRRGQ